MQIELHKFMPISLFHLLVVFEWHGLRVIVSTKWDFESLGSQQIFFLPARNCDLFLWNCGSFYYFISETNFDPMFKHFFFFGQSMFFKFFCSFYSSCFSNGKKTKESIFIGLKFFTQ